jgi:hypothetical protein
MPEGLSASEVGKEIAEHREHAEHAAHAEHPSHGHARRDRLISIIEALLLSIVALMAAWSGYSAAKWSTESALALSKASDARSSASADEIQATQIRTLDSVSFNAVEAAYVSHDTQLFNLTVKRLRAGYRPAFNAWLATHPLKNPNAPADPSNMPQYVIPQQKQRRYSLPRATRCSARVSPPLERRISMYASRSFSRQCYSWSGSVAGSPPARRATA